MRQKTFFVSPGLFGLVLFLCPQIPHYRGNPEAAPLQETDHPPLVAIVRFGKGKTWVAPPRRRPDLGNFIALRKKRGQGFGNYIRGKSPAAHLQTKANPVITARGKRPRR